MKDTEFAFAVAKVRVFENRLLSTDQAERLTMAENDGEAMSILAEKGYKTEKPVPEMLADAEKRLSAEIEEISPVKGLLDYVVIKNDFHNLKTALKDLVTASDNSAGYGPDGICSREVIEKAVKNKEFSRLPSFLEKRAETAYSILTGLYDGQAADIYLDRESLEETAAAAEKTESKLAVSAAKFECTAANIKIAYRAIYTGKDQKFLSEALCRSGEISVPEFIAASRGGTEGLCSMLSGVGYSDIAESIKLSPSAFEKLCDDKLMDIVSAAKLKSFGADPIIAYYYAKRAEIKNIRIIMSCRKLGVPKDEIKQRVRKLYV